MARTLLFVGTYTMPILFGTGEILQGKGKGVHVYCMDPESGRLSEFRINGQIDNPSFIAVNRERTFLYAVNELKEFGGEKSGAVSAFSIDENTGTLEFINQKPTGGQDPCHVCLDKSERHLLISNFMTGSVCVYEIEKDGSLGRRTEFIQHSGKSVDKARQTGPHAHSVTFSPDFRHVYVPDLGIDRVVAYRYDASSGSLRAEPENDYVCKPGSGSRYCEFHPGMPFCYVIEEISSEVTVLKWDRYSGKTAEMQTISTLPPGFSGMNTCADLHITPDGRFLFASNRGHDSLARFAIDGTNGMLSLIGHTPTGGRTPRHFTIAPEGGFVLVGNQDSDCITVFALNSDSGELTRVQTAAAPTPVCLILI